MECLSRVPCNPSPLCVEYLAQESVFLENGVSPQWSCLLLASANFYFSCVITCNFVSLKINPLDDLSQVRASPGCPVWKLAESVLLWSWHPKLKGQRWLSQSRVPVWPCSSFRIHPCRRLFHRCEVSHLSLKLLGDFLTLFKKKKRLFFF